MLTVAIVIASFLAGCSSPTAPKALTGPALKVMIGTAASYPPFESVDVNSKQMVGFDLDLMKAIAAAANLDVQFTNTGYEQVLTAVGECQGMDAAISAIPVSADLKQKMSFSTPYYAFGQVVVVQKGNININGKDSLSGKNVGVQKNSTAAAEAGKISGIHIQPYDVYTIAIGDLINGNVDAVITDKITAMSYVIQPTNNLKIAGNEFASENYAIAVCSKNAPLLARINDGLAAVKATGDLDKLIKKWLAMPMIE